MLIGTNRPEQWQGKQKDTHIFNTLYFTCCHTVLLPQAVKIPQSISPKIIHSSEKKIHCVLQEANSQNDQSNQKLFHIFRNLDWFCEHSKEMIPQKFPRPTAQIHNRCGVGAHAEPVLKCEKNCENQKLNDTTQTPKHHTAFRQQTSCTTFCTF